jgi:lipopolysaccharide transport system permease protein
VMPKENETKWDFVIEPNPGLFKIHFKEIWNYRDLLGIFIKREIVSYYKQTILGPLWFFIQPMLTTAMYVIVFSKIANLSTDGVPPVLFYLSGIVMWNYFADCLNSTAVTFTTNAAIFGKVYFPRIIVPVSKITSNLLKYFIQLGLFIVIYLYYIISGKFASHINFQLVTLPWLLLIMAILSLGLGMIISSLTTKYRDLVFLLTFGIQLFMYATPVIYSLESVKGFAFYHLIAYNPISAVIESFRSCMLGTGTIDYQMLGYATLVSFFIFLIGIIIFNKTEKDFADTI